VTELEKNRIRGLHKEFSVIQEQTQVLKEEWRCGDPGGVTGSLMCKDTEYCTNKSGPRHDNWSCHPLKRVMDVKGGTSRISDKDLKTLIKRTNKKRKSDELREVYSEKQRRWACVQANLPTNKRQKSLSKKEAEEMCKDVSISKKK